jgi:membrane-bound inhibitor of C-type lysozyme
MQNVRVVAPLLSPAAAMSLAMSSLRTCKKAGQNVERQQRYACDNAHPLLALCINAQRDTTTSDKQILSIATTLRHEGNWFLAWCTPI